MTGPHTAGPSRTPISLERSSEWRSSAPCPSSSPTASKAISSARSIAASRQAGLSIIAARMLHLSQREAEGFYAVHRERPFFKDLVRYMSSGPVIVQVLEGEGAIQRNRDIMGATDPKKAAPGTIRADLAASIEQNVVHGSDAGRPPRVKSPTSSAPRSCIRAPKAPRKSAWRQRHERYQPARTAAPGAHGVRGRNSAANPSVRASS